MILPQPATNWNIDQLTTERTEAVSAFGFTERQARFLVEVLIHSGVFVERQYCTFAGIGSNVVNTLVSGTTTIAEIVSHTAQTHRLRDSMLASCQHPRP